MSECSEWLAKILIEETFDRESCEQISPDTFQEKITLHDSEHLRMVLDTAQTGHTCFAFRWDTYWNKELCAYPGNTITDWPILLLQIEGVTRIAILQNEIPAISGTISDLRSEKKGDQFISTITNVTGGEIQIHHTGQFRVALFSATGTRLPLLCM